MDPSEKTGTPATPATMLELPASTDQPSSSRTSLSVQGVKPSGSNDEVEVWRPTKRMYTIFLTMCIITLMAALDATSLSVALPSIAEKLHGSAVEAFWSGTSFLLCSTVFQPSFASLSNIFGRRALILIALVFFTVGAIVAAVANNFTVILVGRCIQGIGGGGVISLTEIVITDIVPLRLRGQYFGFLSSMWALGTVVGPLLGGGFSQNVSWRWIFYINLPFCAIGFVFVPLFLKLNQRMESVREKLARVDWFGSFIFVASTTSLLIPISWGGVMYEWDSWRTLVPLLLGFAGLVGFICWEIYGAVEPMIPLEVFMSRTASVNYVATVCHGIILWCILYYLPLYFEGVRDMSPILTGVAVFPQTFTVAPASMVVGFLVTMTGRFRWALWIGWTLTTLGMGLMYLLDVDTSTVKWVFLNLVAGIGTGMLFPSMAFAIQASATDENMAIAVAMFSFFRAFGQSFGVAIGGVIFQNALIKEFKKHASLAGLERDYAKDAVALVQVIKHMPKGTQIHTDLIRSYTNALQIVFVSMVAFAFVGLLTSFATEKLSLDRVLVSEQNIRDKKSKPSEKDADA